MTSYAQGDDFYVSDLDDSFDQMLLDFVQQVRQYIPTKGKKQMYSAPHVTIYINCEGGDASRALSLVELIDWAKANKVTVSTVVLHAALSAGSIIAVAGSKGYRYCGQNAEYLVHYGESEQTAKSPKDAEAQSNIIKHHFDNMARLYSDNTELSKQDAHDFLSHECYLTAEQALQWGFVDSYL